MKGISAILVMGWLAATACAADDDPALGQKTFMNKCAMCHVVGEGTAHAVGPNLRGLVGRDIGKAAGFAYSDALADASGQWTEARLNDFLTAPQKACPGNAMPFDGLRSEAERKRLIRYLTTLH